MRCVSSAGVNQAKGSLAASGVACAMDLSDGLLGDLPKIMAASGVSARIDTRRIPVLPAVRALFPDKWLELAVRAGEDFELLTTMPAEVLAAIRDQATEIGATLTDIGEVIDAGGMTVMPGMIDCHVHLPFSAVSLQQRLMTPYSLQIAQALANAKLTLEHGFTTVRDAGGTPRLISSMMRTGSSVRGLSEVITTTSLNLEATAPISGRLVRSRSPPHPNTVITRRGASGRAVSSRFFNASSVCA